MGARFLYWLRKTITLQMVVVVLAFCVLFGAAFAFGARMGQRSAGQSILAPSVPVENDQFSPPPRGTFGAIDEIQGNEIRVRDPRSGRTWVVRAGSETVIELGPRRRIPLKNLRVGQRIFVVGAPSRSNQSNEFDAQFIGVVLGQPQKFIKPAVEPMECWDCAD
jgi:hypothetical protein